MSAKSVVHRMSRTIEGDELKFAGSRKQSRGVAPTRSCSLDRVIPKRRQYALSLSICMFYLLALATPVRSQITYHLHREANFASLKLLTDAPEPPSTFSQSENLKDATTFPTDSANTAFFQTPTDQLGTVPASSIVTINVWMQKTANYGTVYPYFKF